MSSSVPPRPPLHEVTARLKARLDAHAATMGITLRRPVAPSELAGRIREANERHTGRLTSAEEQENARAEILQAAAALRASYEGDAMVCLFIDAVLEFLTALVAVGPVRKHDALQNMRESIASMDRYRQGDGR